MSVIDKTLEEEALQFMENHEPEFPTIQVKSANRFRHHYHVFVEADHVTKEQAGYKFSARVTVRHRFMPNPVIVEKTYWMPYRVMCVLNPSWLTNEKLDRYRTHVVVHEARKAIPDGAKLCIWTEDYEMFRDNGRHVSVYDTHFRKHMQEVKRPHQDLVFMDPETKQKAKIGQQS